MTTCIALRHLTFEDAGILEGHFLRTRHQADLCRSGSRGTGPAALMDADLLVVLGGPIGVYETDEYPFVVDEIAALRAHLDRRRRRSAYASAHR